MSHRPGLGLALAAACVLGALVAGSAFAQDDIAAANRRLQGLNNQIDLRFSRLELSLRALVDSVEGLRQQQESSSSEMQAVLDDLRFRLAELSYAIESGGVVTGSGGDVADSDQAGLGAGALGAGTLGVIRTGVDADGNVVTGAGLADGGQGQEASALDSFLDELRTDTSGEVLALTPEQRFNEARDLLKDDYSADAIESFERFIEEYPDHELAPEAKFWLGEGLFAEAEYKRAATVFLDIVRDHRSDDRAPQSLLRVGMSLRNSGDIESACRALALLPTEFPDATARTRQRAEIEAERAGCG